MSAQVKERPILFSGAMVRALLDGSKTQTRRVVKNQPCASNDQPVLCVIVEGGFQWQACDGDSSVFPCPYGQTGDRLWVRETFCLHDNGHEEWPIFRADGTDLPARPATRDPARWKPSIHMPRWASRILLEVVSVRVERLQDIGVEEIEAEGVKTADENIMQHGCRARVIDFTRLWEEINGAGSWDANPWVWVVEFKRVAP